MRPAHDSALKNVLRAVIYGAARAFPVRPGNGAQAAAICESLARHGIASTLGKLSKSGDDPLRIVSEYQNASNAMRCGGAADGFYLSVKPPALQFDAKHAGAIVSTALSNGHGVHFDAHGFDYADQTLAMAQAVMKGFPPDRSRSWTYGLTLPSRWKRSADDARWVAEQGMRPRLVKGDFKGPAAEEMEPVQGLLDLVDRLAGKVPQLALATHDCSLAREVAARCGKKGCKVEIELFFGMPSSCMMALCRELEIPLRFYVPFGDTLLVYIIRDLLLNPRKILRPSAFEVLGSQERKLARIIDAG